MGYVMARWFRLTYVVAFLSMLCAPLLAAHRLSKNSPCHPANILAEGSPWAHLKACQDSFNQQFIVGDTIHTAGVRWMYRLFGVSYVPEVVAGTDDWLYLYGGAYPNDHNIAHEPFASGEVETWVDSLAAWHAYLSQRGIGMVFVVAPDKHTVYPEHLPWHLRQSSPKVSRLDTLIGALRADGRTQDLVVVDPKEALRAQKALMELYYRGDTHWNYRGGFVGYQEIMRALQPWYPAIVPLNAADFRVQCGRTPGEDLARMLKLNSDDLFRRCELAWPESFARDHGHPMTNRTAWEATDPNADLPSRAISNLLVWGDSFSVGLLPFVLAHTQKARVVVAGLMDTDDLAWQKPDLVIIEKVDRALYLDAPPAPQPLRGYSFGEGFFQELGPTPPKERWMTQDAVLRVNAQHVQKHRQLAVSFRIPAEVAAAGSLTYALGDQAPKPVPQKGLRGYVTIGREQWPQSERDCTLTLHGVTTMVPASACGRSWDIRKLTAAVEVAWLD